MSSEPSPPGGLFDRLIEAMPNIAKAVNAFALEDNQRTALEALLAAAGARASAVAPSEVRTPLAAVPPLPTTGSAGKEEHDAPPAVPDTPTGAAAAPPEAHVTQAVTPKRVRKAAGAKKVYSRAKDLNFHPEGKISLRDFWTQKAPGNNHERNLVIVRYLEETLQIEKIEVGQVLAGYEAVDERSPAIPDNSLMVTASQKGWLDTSDMKAIRTTHGGINFLKFDMPKKKKTA